MKNIHVLPTDKPSLICKVNNVLVLSKIGTITNDTKSLIRQNICITSESEDIKDNTWVLNIVNGSIYKTYNGKPFNKDSEKEKWRKIILTTDQDLIKDGIQAIDDEFLEWFVKNPSCEEIMLWRFHGINTSIAEVNAISGDGSLNWQGKGDFRDYKIIIPKEESFIEYTNTNDCTSMIYNSKEQPKQEKMYSEEEVLKAQQAILANIKDALQDENYIINYLKQFKNK